MLLKQTLPRAREHLAVIEAEAPVREAAYLMSKPDGRCCHEIRHCQPHQSLHRLRLHNQSGKRHERRAMLCQRRSKSRPAGRSKTRPVCG